MEIIPIDWDKVTPNAIIVLVVLAFLFIVWKSIKWKPEDNKIGASRIRYNDTDDFEKQIREGRK